MELLDALGERAQADGPGQVLGQGGIILVVVLVVVVVVVLLLLLLTIMILLLLLLTIIIIMNNLDIAQGRSFRSSAKTPSRRRAARRASAGFCRVTFDIYVMHLFNISWLLFIYIYISIYLSIYLSISLSLYIYIYIYTHYTHICGTTGLRLLADGGEAAASPDGVRGVDAQAFG